MARENQTPTTGVMSQLLIFFVVVSALRLIYGGPATSCTNEFEACRANSACFECLEGWGGKTALLECEERYDVIQSPTMTVCLSLGANYCCHIGDDDADAEACMESETMAEYLNCNLANFGCSLSDMPCYRDSATSPANGSNHSAAADKAPASAASNIVNTPVPVNSSEPLLANTPLPSTTVKPSAVPTAMPMATPISPGRATVPPTLAPRGSAGSTSLPMSAPIAWTVDGFGSSVKGQRVGASAAWGPAFVAGSFSATGVSDVWLAKKGEESIVREAVCALGSCPDGPDSVIIGESETHRILLAEETWRRPQRRLADLEDVVFGMFTAGGSRDGKALTESQQAALLFNTIANPMGLSAVAKFLGVDVERVNFGNLRYFQGGEFAFMDEFDAGSSDLSSVRAGAGAGAAAGANADAGSTWPTYTATAMVAVASFLLIACLFCCVKNHMAEMKRRERAYVSHGLPPPSKAPSKFSTADAGKIELPASNTSSKDQKRRVRFSSPPKSPTAHSFPTAMDVSRVAEQMRSADTAVEDENANPMNRGWRASVLNTDGNALAQHYKGDHDDSSDSDWSCEGLPDNETDNPLFREPQLGDVSPTSSVVAAANREAARALSPAAGRSKHQLGDLSPALSVAATAYRNAARDVVPAVDRLSAANDYAPADVAVNGSETTATSLGSDPPSFHAGASPRNSLPGGSEAASINNETFQYRSLRSLLADQSETSSTNTSRSISFGSARFPGATAGLETHQTKTRVPGVGILKDTTCESFQAHGNEHETTSTAPLTGGSDASTCVSRGLTQVPAYNKDDTSSTVSPQQTSSQAPGRFNGNRFNLAFNGEGVGKRVHGSTKAALPPRSPGPPSTVSPQEGKTADVQLAVADESVPSWFSVARTIVSDGGRKTPLTRHMSIESYTSNQSHGSLSFSDSDSDCEVGGSAERHREELDGGTLLSAEANGTLWQQLDEPDPHGKFSRRQESENPVTPSNKPAISVDEASSTSSDATDSRFDSFKTIATELSMRKNEAVVWRPPRPGVGRSQSVPWNLWHTVNGGGKAADEEKGEMEEKSETGIEPRVASAYQKLFTRGTRRRAVEEHMFWSA